MIDWLRPEEGAITTLGEAVGQCVKLAGDDWRMRATQATVEMPGAGRRGEGIEGRRAGAHRHVVARLDRPASRLARHRGRRGARGDRVDLRLRALASKRAPPLPASIVYHALGWEDVALLAAAHGVICDSRRRRRRRCASRCCRRATLTAQLDKKKPERDRAPASLRRDRQLAAIERALRWAMSDRASPAGRRTDR